MIVYLDNSFLNRPFDDPELGVNKLEAEILLSIIKLAKNGKVNLINSSVIEYENSVNPFAAGEKAKVDLFITCDYNLIKKYKGNIKIIAPLEFFRLYEHTSQ